MKTDTSCPRLGRSVTRAWRRTRRARRTPRLRLRNTRRAVPDSPRRNEAPRIHPRTISRAKTGSIEPPCRHRARVRVLERRQRRELDERRRRVVRRRRARVSESGRRATTIARTPSRRWSRHRRGSSRVRSSDLRTPATRARVRGATRARRVRSRLLDLRPRRVFDLVCSETPSSRDTSRRRD